jgi:hypothetical protein
MATNIKCPKCAREFCRRVSRSGWAEVLLSYLYLYPFKCQLCGFRFRHFQPWVRYVRVEEDRREYDRMEMNLPVSFYGQEVSGEGALLNVSMGGCSFRTDAKVEAGAILNLSLQISQEVPPVVVDAAVVRNVGQSHVGVEFLLWQQGERERLQLFIRGLLIGRGVELEPLVGRSETLWSR